MPCASRRSVEQAERRRTDIQVPAHGQRRHWGCRKAVSQRDQGLHRRAPLAGHCVRREVQAGVAQPRATVRLDPDHPVARATERGELNPERRIHVGARRCDERGRAVPLAAALPVGAIEDAAWPQGAEAVRPHHAVDPAGARIDRQVALAEARVGQQRTGGTVVADTTAVEHRQGPLDAGLGGFKRLGRAVLVASGALFEDQAAVRVRGDQRHDEEQHHHDDQRRGTALARARRGVGCDRA